MRSATFALAWEIWSSSRMPIRAIVLMTAFALIAPDAGGSAIVELAGILSFVFLFAVFNDPEFPFRRFTLPITSFQLVAVPMALGVVSVELLYVLWSFTGRPALSFFSAALFAVFMLCFQAATWMLAPFGALRLIAIGALGVGFIAVGTMAANQAMAATLAIALGAATVVCGWQFVARMRSRGGERMVFRAAVIDVPASVQRRPITRFASPAAAQAWLEWRRGGVTLPLLVGALLVGIAPFTWLVRADRALSVSVLMLTLGTPMVLAIPVGVAFSKPRFWSDDLTVPDSLAVRPLRSDEWVAIKMSVAVKAAAISWLLVLVFVALWLPLWFDRLVLRQLWPGWTNALLIGGATLFITWRFLIVRMWAGLSGSRRLYFGSGVAAVFIPIAALIFQDDLQWLVEDPRRLTLLLWMAAIALAMKYALASYLWVRSRNGRRQPLLICAGASIYFVGLAVWQYGWRGLPILLALLVAPLARMLAAPVFLEKNRHRA